MPERIQLSRAKGWRMPGNTVKVDRTTRWGNPFNFKKAEWCWIALSLGCRGDARGRQEASVKAFREWIAPGNGKRTVSMVLNPKLVNGTSEIPLGPMLVAGEAPDLKDLRAALRGKNLACWCRHGDPCHADVLIELANAPVPEQADPLVEAQKP